MLDDYDFFRKAVGQKIQSFRKQQGFTQEDMEEGDHGIPLRTVQDIETGKSNATLKSLYRISKRLKIHPKELLDVKWKKKK